MKTVYEEANIQKLWNLMNTQPQIIHALEFHVKEKGGKQHIVLYISEEMSFFVGLRLFIYVLLSTSSGSDEDCYNSMWGKQLHYWMDKWRHKVSNWKLE